MDVIVYAVVVLYNVNIEDTETYHSLQKQTNSNFKILFVDNSTIVTSNAQYASNKGIDYVSMNGNAGISNAYNCAIEFLYTKANYLIWLDDDTTLPFNFIDMIIKQLDKQDIKVWLPLVTSNQRIISPTKPKEWNKYFSTVEEIENELPQVTAINSGMCVSMSCYETYRYDNRIFLDYVDHVFMEHVREKQYAIGLLPVELVQNFSMDTKGNTESVQQRFNIFMNDVATAYEGRTLHLFLIRLKYGIRIMLTQKDVRFFYRALLGKKFK